MSPLRVFRFGALRMYVVQQVTNGNTPRLGHGGKTEGGDGLACQTPTLGGYEKQPTVTGARPAGVLQKLSGASTVLAFKEKPIADPI